MKNLGTVLSKAELKTINGSYGSEFVCVKVDGVLNCFNVFDPARPPAECVVDDLDEPGFGCKLNEICIEGVCVGP